MAVLWPTTWRGTPREFQELLVAVQHHCSCAYTRGTPTDVCAGHRMVVDDQRALDGLLFVRRLAARLRHQEESEPSAPLAPARDAGHQVSREARG